MRQVFFEKLWVENFCNHIGRVELDFTTGKVVLITGPNGSGKTSLIQALPYALYGQCEKGRGDDVLNDKVMKNCCAGVSFRIGQHLYTAERFIKYSKVGTTAILKQNGIIMANGHKEVVPLIERILIPREGFFNTLLFSQKVKTFFTDLQDSEQKNIFRKVLALDNHILYLDETTKRIKQIGTEILELNRKLDLNIGLQKESESTLKVLIKEQNEFESKKEKSIIEFENILKSLNNRKIEISDLLDFYNKEKLEDKVSSTSEKIGFITSKLNSISNDLEPKLKSIDDKRDIKLAEMKQSAEVLKSDARDKMNQEVKILNDRNTKIKNNILILIQKIDKKLNKISVELASLQSSLKHITPLKNKHEQNLSSLSDPTCPTCKQSISEDILIELQKELSEYNREINELGNKITQLKREESQNMVEKNSLNKDLEEVINNENLELKRLESKFNETCTAANERLSSIEFKINDVAEKQKDLITKGSKKESSDMLRELNILKTKNIEIEKSITDRDNKQKELNDLNIRITKISTGLEKEKESQFDDTYMKELIEKCNGFKKEVRELTHARTTLGRRNEILEFWKKGFSNSGIQSFLIGDSIPFMNRRISEYMDKLCNGRYVVTFDTLSATKGGEFRDKIQVNVFDNITHSDKRVKFSGGQKRLVDIGTILTLHDLQSQVQDVEFNLLLFDEIFDSLDEENTEYTAKLIRQVSKDKWTGIISHTKIDQIEADETLSFG